MLGGVGLVVLPFTLRNLLVFGKVLPAGRSLRFFMRSYADLYRFLSDPTPEAWWAQGWPALRELRIWQLLRHLEHLSLQIPWPILAFAIAGAVVLLFAHRLRGAPMPLFLVLQLVVPVLAVPLIASVDRFTMNTLPVLVILAVIGAFEVGDMARRLVDHRVVVALIVAGAAYGSTFWFREPRVAKSYIDGLVVYRDTHPALYPATVAPLHLSPNDVVLTDDPWRVAAVLDVAALNTPVDGPLAVEAVMAKYRPRFVLAGNQALKDLVARGRFPLRQVAVGHGLPWYELTEGVKNADGSPR